MKIFKIALGADHAGYGVKKVLIDQLTKEGYRVIDFGTHSEEPCDYPDIAARVARAVSTGRCDRGVLACGTGLGMHIAANKVPGIRAATCWSVPVARLSAEHNWCNVLCVASRFTPVITIKKITRAWLKTPFDKGGRHERRVKKMEKLEAKACDSFQLHSKS